MSNPLHESNKANMTLLDVASGHFSHIEYRSNGSFPSTVLSEFSHIAREYHAKIQASQGQQSAGQQTVHIIRGDDAAKDLLSPEQTPVCKAFTPTRTCTLTGYGKM